MDQPLRILHLEDDPDYSEVVKAMLAEAGLNVEMLLVDTLADFTAALEREHFDVLLGDFKLPTCTGIQALERARQVSPELPFILVSGTIGEHAAIESLKGGATDYVLKQWPERLVPAVRRAAQEARERAQRKLAEAELIRREKYFRALTENSLDVLSILNRDGRFQYNSPSLMSVLGYEPEELVGRNAFDLVHPEDMDTARRAFAEMLRHARQRITSEFRYRQKTGFWCRLEVIGQNRLDDPDIAGLVFNLRDITERHQAAAALFQSKERFRNLIETTSDLVWEVDEDGRYTYLSPRLCDILGYEPEQMLGKTPFDLMPEEEARRVAAIFNASAARREPFSSLENVNRHREGHLVLLETSGVPFFDSSGNFKGYRGMDRDITARKQAEAHLRLQSSALEAAANVIVITNRDGDIIWANPAFARVTGYTVGEVLGRNPKLLKSGHHPPAFYQNLWETILSGRVWHSEMVNRRKDGSLYTEEVTITPVHAGHHEITHFIAVKQDVTARKELESQLRQAQKMEAVGQLAGGVAHDFNNILTVIQGHASLLLGSGGLPAPAAGSAQQISLAAERAAGLTRQLLAFSRRQVMQLQLLDLNELVGNLTKMLGRVLGEHIALQLNYSPQPPLVRADAGMVEQVLLNLIVNARDAMPKGGRLAIDISTATTAASGLAHSAEARPGRYVCLSVRDSGCGIAPEVLPHIFEPFFTTKEVGKGTGLGLATVYGIIKQHQGWVEVESAPEQGTTFQVFLPASGETAAPSDHPARIPSVRGGTETILVVEDEPTVRELACAALAGWGYQVLHAASGVEALAVWRQHQGRIDLLLTDLVMPGGLNGWELAETLWAEQPDLKVVFTSGYGMEVAGGEFVLRNQKHFLPKPFPPHKLALMVRDCLDAARRSSGGRLAS